VFAKQVTHESQNTRIQSYNVRTNLSTYVVFLGSLVKMSVCTFGETDKLIYFARYIWKLLNMKSQHCVCTSNHAIFQFL